MKITDGHNFNFKLNSLTNYDFCYGSFYFYGSIFRKFTVFNQHFE